MRFSIIISFFLLVINISVIFSQNNTYSNDINIVLIEKQNEFRKEIEEKIKNNILDPVLGKDRAFAFADVLFEIITKKRDQSKEGVGVLQQYKEKGASQSYADTDFILPGIPKPKYILGDDKRPEAAHGRQTQQTLGVEEVKFSVEPTITKFQVTVLHDEKLPQGLLMIARERIDDLLLPYKIGGKDPPIVIFKPTKFNTSNIWDDIKKPLVYLPLLYAILLLLFLFYLFGPLWSFLRRYLKAIMEKPGAEVNIEDKREEGGKGEGKGEGEEKQEGHQAIDMNFIQKEEEEVEEEEEMKKLEPFTYINEENLKKLIYLFLLKKEDPWIIAVILSYLKPEISKQAFAMLPVELQSKVAIESLKVKQATREQIEAIDKEVKESVEFVMGGVEQLMKILEEADPQTRKNVLEYLKNQKPDIYEKIRSIMLIFEDIVSFSDKDIQTIIRSVSNEDLAKALKGASPQISDKFFRNMSQGAQNTIKEIIEYMGELTQQQIDEAQMKIVDTVKTLEAEGKIASYRKSEGGIYIIESDISSAARDKRIEKASQTQSQQEDSLSDYMSKAVDAYNSQDFETAISYLRYVIEAEPENAVAWQYLGSSYYSIGNYAEAVSAYDNYVKLSNDMEFKNWLDDLKRQLGM
ncbi:MAG: hypothetical protein K6357_08085 [Elusimicrobiota bacterium]